MHDDILEKLTNLYPSEQKQFNFAEYFEDCLGVMRIVSSHMYAGKVTLAKPVLCKLIHGLALSSKWHDSIVSLIMRKNAAYSDSTKNFFYNFESIQRYYGINPVTGFIVRINDKIMRGLNLCQHPEVDNLQESLQDTYNDLYAYLLLLYVYLDREE